MTNGKSDRKKLVKGLVTIIVVIIAAVLGINITDLVPNEENGQETVVQDSTQIEHGVEEIEGELILTMIDQTTPNMIQRISGIFERKPLISREI